MTTLIVEQDHFLQVMPVILDPATPPEHRAAWDNFFSHDMPDFFGWCAALQARIPGLYPARVVFADSQAALHRLLPEADAALVESLRIGPDELALAPNLACVQRFGTVATNIDVTACSARGVRVEILRRRVNVAVAEQAFLLMIGLAKQVARLAGQVTEPRLAALGQTIRPYDTRYSGASNFARIGGLGTLQGATLGIVGMGEIGRELASRAAAFDMRVLYTQRNRIPLGDEFASRATYCALDDLLAQADYVSLNLPTNDSTRGIINAAALARMKPGAALVNVSRAELIDRSALLASLGAERIRLGTDVWYEEPVRADDPILALPNVLLMPHTAIGHRENAARDLEEMCLKLWRGVTDRDRSH